MKTKEFMNKVRIVIEKNLLMIFSIFGQEDAKKLKKKEETKKNLYFKKNL